MTTSETTTRPVTGRLLGLPSVARLALFARHEGPAVLLTTSERLEHFADAKAFGAAVTMEPGPADWHALKDKVVVSLDRALSHVPEDPRSLALRLETGHDYPREDLLASLIELGFERDAAPGFAVRGDTVTVHLSEEDAEGSLRLEFFGDELETISLAGEPRREHVLAPVSLAEYDRSTWTRRLLEHLPGTVFLDAPELMPGAVDAEGGGVAPVAEGPSTGVLGTAWLWGHLAGRQVVSFGRDPLPLERASVPLEPLGYYRGKLTTFAQDVHMWVQDGYSVHVLLRFERTGRYLREKVLDEHESHWRNEVGERPGQVSLLLAKGAQGGYRDPTRKEVVLTEELLYGYQGGRRLKRLPGKAVHDASQLQVGDYLIHPDHGIGRFLGLEPRQVVGVTRDYLLLQYAGEGKLYLPVEQLPLLRRHPGTTDDPPRLSTLGTNEWARAREKARVNASELAAELIKAYAKRQVSTGTAFPPLPEWDPLIDKNFAYELTPDQAKAVEEVFTDLEREVPMDRLISGDVGFGKTEVAIRAAHRVVGHGYQVAMLVPTTVLAKQHFETFKARFEGLPVRVEMLSRFTPDKLARDVLKGLKEGGVDVVVGTHRLLAEAIEYKRLGLLIVDEEHRFGVGQKERLKSLKADVDVLSLSATPIPRTLYMSLVGLRDVSQILTPPRGRKPIQTVLQPYDPLTVRDAVLYELERGGKVFYIHDRVGSMSLRARTLSQLVPEARIGVAHGQMPEDELEEVMIGFDEGAYDVLLSTTIVESGLDITGANTLVIERADRLGLAQLYQLRGRVGRRETEAWAYLLYPGRLTEQAQRRLYAIAELNDLGSGHLLAEKDMEIRGVGNLLGPEQHGHISAVSLEVYTELLAEEIAKLKGEEMAAERPQVTIDLSVDARLSPTYVQDDDERVAYYGRFAETDSLAEVSRVAKELREAHGPFPPEVKAFVELTRLRILAGAKGVATVKEHMTDVQISLHADDMESLDYDAKALKQLPFQVEATRYPPGFSIKKRGLKPEQLPGAVTDVLYLLS
jgi:transcription-repair coupling factor (superfamily II helicase)